MNAPAHKPGSFELSLLGGRHGKGFKDVTGQVFCGHTALRFLHQQDWMFRCPAGHEFRYKRVVMQQRHERGLDVVCPTCKEQNHG